MPFKTNQQDIFTVSRLNNEIKYALQGSFPSISVSGEISNLATPRSGHVYFSLKDEKSQIRCVMFRSKRKNCVFNLENGQQIIARVSITLYEARGDMQLLIESVALAGQGDLQQQFNDLKIKLLKAGLFAEKHKKTLPVIAKKIGIISSPTGAAVHDIIAVLKRRYPALGVIIYPTLVQGEQASREIQQALTLAQSRQECDLLILSRGGGSLEDLNAFNNEDLARQIYHCNIPIISAVGHEIDFTIADFVADKRAATPSAAAELASPDQQIFFQQLNGFEIKLKGQIRQQLKQNKHYFNDKLRRLSRQNPVIFFHQKQQQLDYLENKLISLIKLKQQANFAHLKQIKQRLKPQLLKNQLKQKNSTIQRLEQQLIKNMVQKINDQQNRFQQLTKRLSLLNPLTTLQRGYTFIQIKNKKPVIISSAKQLKVGDEVCLFFKDGQRQAVIKK